MDQMSKHSEMKIDLDAVLRERLPKLSQYIPQFVVNWMKRTIRQDRLNEILEENAGLEGADFARGALRSLDITVNSFNEDLLPPADHRKVLYVSNHPLGGLDGMALIDSIQRRHGEKVYFVVNDLLSAVKPLAGIFLPVNKHGSQHREAAARLEEAFSGNDPVIMFPAGLVSRLQTVKTDGRTDNVIKDLQWNRMFVNKAIQYQRDVIPVYFQGKNSRKFYHRARLRERLGLKFNFEMIYLPGEMVAMEHSSLSIYFGRAIPFGKLSGGKDAQAQADKIKEIVYQVPYKPL